MASNIIADTFTKLAGEDENGVLKERLSRYWNSAFSARKELDWKWFNYHLWVDGLHDGKWNKSTQQILAKPRADGKPRVMINKTFTTIRAVRSYVLQNKPKPTVTPYNMTDQDLDQAVALGKYLDYVHDSLHLRQSLRASMWHALKYSVGFWQVLWDEDAEDGQGQIKVNVVDPFDLYIDPTAKLPKEARYMILAVQRNIDDLRDDPKYDGVDWDKIKTDNQMAASTLKARILNFEKGGVTFNDKDKKTATAIVKEYWYKEMGDEDVDEEDQEAKPDKDGNKPTKKSKRRKQRIMLCTMIGEQIIRGPLDTGLDRFPFFRLSSDIEPLSMYGNGWVKNIIPVNRLLETLEESVAEYNVIVNKGKYTVPKNAGIRVINNEHGQIIEHKAGAMFAPQPVQIPAMNPAVMEQIQNANRYIEDIGCMHDASLGRVPSGVKSGIGVETLMEGDSNNLSELTENTSEFLEDVYEYILKIASEKYQTMRNIVLTSQSGEREFISVIGEGAHADLQGDNATVIPGKNAVDVKIESWLAYTSDGRRQAVGQLAQIMLAQQQPLPVDVILDAFEVGNTAEIVQKIREDQKAQQEAQLQQQQQQMEQQGQLQQQQMQQQQQGQMQMQAQQAQQAQQQQQAQEAGVPQATAVIRQLISGEKPQMPQVVGADFINYLDHFIQSPEGQQLGGALLSVLQSFRDQAVMLVPQAERSQVQ